MRKYETSYPQTSMYPAVWKESPILPELGTYDNCCDNVDSVLRPEICHLSNNGKNLVSNDHFVLRGAKMFRILACHRSLSMFSRCRMSQCYKIVASPALPKTTVVRAINPK